jgi:hypothetical protein
MSPSRRLQSGSWTWLVRLACTSASVRGSVQFGGVMVRWYYTAPHASSTSTTQMMATGQRQPMCRR